MNRDKILLGIIFLMAGFFSLLKYFRIVEVSTGQIIGTALLLYSIPSVHFSLGNGDRKRIIRAAVLFCTGVVLTVESYFEVTDPRGIVFASILFCSGTIFLLLYIENTKQKIFLPLSIVMMLLSYLSVTLFKEWGLFYYTNKIGNLLEIVWPVLLILFGVIIFNGRKKTDQ